MEKRGIISTILKRVKDCPRKKNSLMFLFRHYLTGPKVFPLNIDNTVKGRILKGADNSINLCDQTIYNKKYSDIDLFDIMPVSTIGGGV